MTRKASLKLILGGLFGFYLFWLASHPRSRVHRKIPEVRLKNVSLLPSIRYHKKDRIYHFHHWFLISIFYLPLVYTKKLRRSHVFHGLLLGSILQGLSYKERFKFVYSKKIDHLTISSQL